MEKGVLKSNLPIDADLERSWDLGAAIKRVKDWATSDGKIDFTKYSKAFLWMDGEGKSQEDYKLPFADVIDGEVKAVYLGLSAAMKAVTAGKSGVEMEGVGCKELLGEIASYYKQFDPELKSVSAFIGEPSEAHKTAAEVFEALKAEKGAVADQLAEEEAEELKMGMLRDFWEVIYAFCDVWHDENTTADQFQTLLTETVSILLTVADGTYEGTEPADDPQPVAMALANGVDKEQVENFIQSYIKSRPEKSELDADAGAIRVLKSEDGVETPVYGVQASYDAKEKVAIASTSVMDRQGERIDQAGWDLKNFKNNPVLLWAHDHSEISVGNAKNIHIEKVSGTPRLVFTPDFHDHTDKAKALKALYDEGRMNSFSVGFIPKDMDGATSTYLKQELLEISACNVPANPDARMMAVKTLQNAGIPKKTMAELGFKAESEQVEDVLDKTPPPTEDEPNEPLVKTQEPSVAPQESSTVRAEQSLVKAILRASDKILLEKKGQEQDESVKLQKVIKRAAEILSTSQRRKLEDGKTR